MNTLEERLSKIDWSKLNHAYGDAGDVPDALLALLHPRKKVRESALRHLRHSINHQGFPEDSTPVAVPFLMEIAQTPGVQDRDRLLSFFSELSLGHRLTKLAHLEEMTLSGWRPEQVVVNLYQEVYDEVCKGIPFYLTLLDDADEKVQHQALYLLAWLAPAAPILLPVLRRRQDEKVSDALRLGLSIALGLSLFFMAEAPNQSDREHLAQELTSKSLLRRFGAAVGLCYLGEAPTRKIVTALREALLSIKDEGVPWNGGHLGSYVGVILSWIHKTKSADVVPVYQAALEEKAKALNPRSIKYRGAPGMWPDYIAESLLTIAFETKPTKKWPEGYTPLQRWIIRFLVRHPNLSISEGYCTLKEYINRLDLPHPTQKKEKLRLQTLEDLTLLTGEEQPRFGEILHQKIRVKGKSASLLQLWERAVRANRRARRGWLVEIRGALSCGECCTFIEELLAQPEKTHLLKEEESQTLSLFVAMLAQRAGMLDAVKETAALLVQDGCLRYPMPSRLVFGTFAALLLRMAPEESALGAALLKASPQFFEHQDTESIRDVLLMLPEKERGEVIDTLHIRSFAEPDEAWSLYDIAPSAKRIETLIKVLREYADFFVGPGAYRLVELLSAMPSELLAPIVEELRRPRALRLGYAHVLAASLMQHPERSVLLRDITEHKDPRVRWMLKKNRRLSAKEMLQLEISADNKMYARAKGGVIGANGKPWDGSMPRFKPANRKHTA
jgi:hypothetical protein